MKKFTLVAAVTIAVAGFTSSLKANLQDVGALILPPGTDLLDPAARAAGLDSQFDTGPLTLLGRYVIDRTGAVTFVPGAITDPSQLSFTLTDRFTGLLSWDFTGTGFRGAFVVTLLFGNDFAFDEAFRVTPDQFVNSRGPQLIFGTPIDFFGSPTSVSDAGDTALLLGTAVAGLALTRCFWRPRSPAS